MISTLAKVGNLLNERDGLFNLDFDSLFSPSCINAIEKFETDVYEKDGNWTIEAAVPGVKKEEISIDVDDGILSISIEKKKETNVEKQNYILKEINYGSQTREFKLPKGIDKTNPEAELKDGILKVVFMKNNRKLIDIK